MPGLCSTCPMCGGDAPVLGILGSLTWYRCECCGWTFTPGNDGDV